ncbi:hypothetical protein HDU76_004174 [Blyttiomyces sp. JEL0837]|nr:hypothetical protein HDU76_004174 [Blyttiomyces sp. JEL0837]
MLASEFIMVHALPNGVEVEILELVSTGYFKPPMPNPSGTSMLARNPPGSPPHVVYQGNGVLLAEFRRYTTPSEGESTNVPLDITNNINILLAYNSNPKPTPSESWKISHGRNTPTGNRQKFVLHFMTGKWSVYFGGSIESKMLHGVGMGFVFMILNPLGVYWASFASYIISKIPTETNFGPNAYFSLINHPHSVMGLMLLCLILIQSFLGPLNRLSLLLPSLYNHRDLIRLCHHVIGFTVTFGSFFQVGLGLYTLHPLPESLPSYYNRGFHWWILYGLFAGGWIGLFVLSEGVWKSKFKVRRHTWDFVRKSLEKRFGVGAVGNVKMFAKNGYTLGGVGVGVDGNGNAKGGWWNNENQENAGGKVKSFGFVNRSGEHEGTRLTFGRGVTGSPNMTARKAPGKSGFTIIRPSVPTTILQNAAVVKKDEKVESWKVFSWAEIDEALKNGESYVVANGRFVYDINQWIYSHPGGSIILQQVAGTDVTNDYFNESGYDASAFVPKQALSRTLSMSNLHRNLPTIIEPLPEQEDTMDTVAPQSQSQSHLQTPQPPKRRDSRAPSIVSSLRAAELLSISELEWKMLVKARRTNVHSKLAVEKLSSLMVGEIAQENNGQNGFLGGGFRFVGDDDENGGNGIEFSPMEYRRYALISTQLVSEATCQNPVYKQKFCILYPFDTRKNEPTEFLPGQCIEIQMKVKNTIVSRYYTPQSGSPTCFEIHVKLVRQGQLTPQLVRQRLGDRQIKIRGPFGTPLLSLVRGIPGNSLGFGLNELMPFSFDRMLFVCGGSGLAPLIHYLEWMFLAKNVPLYVIQTYEASQDDEISLKEGDWVTVSEHLHDGWAIGRNQRTHQEGLFPLPITIPRCGFNARIAIVNAVRTPQEAFGGKTLRSVLLAYPNHVTSVTHCLSRWNNDKSQDAMSKVSDACPGDVAPGRVSMGAIVDALDRCRWVSNVSLNKKVVLCGPQSFEGAMVDVLESCGVDHRDVMILPPNTYI